MKRSDALRRVLLNGCCTVVLAIVGLMAAASAHAETAEQFYRGKNLTILVGVAPGGSFDLYARLAARHLGSHIPGQPNVVVRNMSGAGGLTALNYLYQVAPRDGTWLHVAAPTAALVQVLGQPGLQYDARKLNWVGRLTSITQVFYTWHTSQTRTLADLKTRETLIGGTGPAADSTVFSNLLNDLVGTKFKVIQGYNETAATMLAMERGEVDGVLRPWEGMKSGQERTWMAEKKINLVAQYVPQRHAELASVGTVYELTGTEQQRRILGLFLSATSVGRALTLGPDIPEDRLKVLRASFDAMVKDPAFLADATKLNMAIAPAAGAELAQTTAETFQVTPAEIEIARKYYR